MLFIFSLLCSLLYHATITRNVLNEKSRSAVSIKDFMRENSGQPNLRLPLSMSLKVTFEFIC